MQQILFPGSLKLSPKVSYAPPVLASDLLEQAGPEGTQPLIVSRAQALLLAHTGRQAPAGESGPPSGPEDPSNER